MSAVTAELKLIALDADDLAVISAHVQDAQVQTADIVWRQGEKRLVVGMSRLDWEQTLAGEASPRRLIAACGSTGCCRANRAISISGRRRPRWSYWESSFIPVKPPAGSAVLLFAQGGALRLDVECLECELTDLGADDLGTADPGEGAEPSGLGA